MVIAAAATAVAVVVLLVVVVVVGAGTGSSTGDDTTATTSESAAADPVHIGEDANVEVPATADDGNDAAGNTVSYAATNLTDGDPTTTWRMNGDATGDMIEVSWPRPVTLTDVGLINGYAKVDEVTGAERYAENRRVLAVTWIFPDGSEVSRSLEETTTVQMFTLDTPIETASVQIRIDSTSPPGGRDFTAISELSFLAR